MQPRRSAVKGPPGRGDTRPAVLAATEIRTTAAVSGETPHQA